MTKLLVTPGGVSVAAVQQQMERQKFEARHAPRMIFAMDATGSREPTWEMAGKLHREMGAALGSLTLQLVFFGGTECKASGWVVGGQRLAELMTKVRCNRLHSDRPGAAACPGREPGALDPRIGLRR